MGPFNLPAFSLQGAADRAQMLAQLRATGSKVFMDGLFTTYLGGAPDYSWYQGSGVSGLQYYAAVKGQNVFIFVAGITTNAQGQQVLTGYSGTVATFSAGNENAQFATWATQIYNQLSILPVAPITVYMAGHSAGGGVCLAMAGTKPWPAGTTFNISTFGSPKILTQAGLTAPNYLPLLNSVCLWTNYDDAIPAFPPRQTYSFFSTNSGFTYNMINRMNLFLRTPYGKILNQDLSVSNGNVSTEPLPSSMDDFATWFAQNGNYPDSGHNILVYASRLSAAYALASTPQNAPPPVPNPPLTPPVTAASARVAMAPVQSVYVTNERAQNVQTPLIPTSNTFQAKRVAKIWYVYFGGVAISAGPRRKTAQGLARAGNDFIRRLQRQGAVDATNLSDQWTLFIDLATDPTSGIVPTLAPPP
jgi:hypothetical protein